MNELIELKGQREEYVKKYIGDSMKPFDYKLKLNEFDKKIQSIKSLVKR